MNARLWLVLGGAAGLLAVGAGAFGAHLLKNRLALEGATIYHTAVQYQFYHALALLVVGVLIQRHPRRALDFAGAAFAGGIATFSGSLYLLALTGQLAFAVITPVGGVLFLVGWALLIFSVLHNPRAK